MKICIEIQNFKELYNQSFLEAKYTLQTIKNHNKENELMNYLDQIYPDGTDERALNDFLSDDREWIYQELGIKEDQE